MGRKPAKNPKDIHLGIRIDEGTAAALDKEIELEEQHRPGLGLTRSDVVRMLMVEALAARQKARRKR